MSIKLTFAILDNHLAQIWVRIVRFTPVAKATQCPPGAWAKVQKGVLRCRRGEANGFVHTERDFSASLAKSDGDKWTGAIEWRCCRVVFTTDPQAASELVKKHLPAVVLLDVNWDEDGVDYGITLGEQLIGDPSAAAAIAIIFKTVDRGSSVPPAIERAQRSLGLRTPFFFGEFKNQISQLQVASGEKHKVPKTEGPAELARVQLALLALHEQELASRARKTLKIGELATLLSSFAGDYGYYGWFSKSPPERKAYEDYLRRRYLKAFLVGVHPIYRVTCAPQAWLTAHASFMRFLEQPVRSDAKVEKKDRNEEARKIREILRKTGQLAKTRRLENVDVALTSTDGDATFEMADGPLDHGFVADCHDPSENDKIELTRFSTPAALEPDNLKKRYGKLATLATNDGRAHLRFMLRYGTMHILETALAALLPLGSKPVQNTFHQKLNSDDLANAMKVTVIRTSAAKLTDSLRPLVGGYTADVASNEALKELRKLAGLPGSSPDDLADALAATAVDDENTDRLWSALEIIERTSPNRTSAHFQSRANDFRQILVADILILGTSRNESGVATKSHRETSEFSKNCFTLIDPFSFPCQATQAHRLMKGRGTVVERIITALKSDPLNPAALLAMHGLTDQQFSALAKDLFECKVETGLHDYAVAIENAFDSTSKDKKDELRIGKRPWVPVFQVRVNLLEQVVTGLHFLKTRVEVFCSTVASAAEQFRATEGSRKTRKKADGDENNPRQKANPFLESANTIAALWRARGWDKLFKPNLVGAAAVSETRAEAKYDLKVVLGDECVSELTASLPKTLKVGTATFSVENLKRSSISAAELHAVFKAAAALLEDDDQPQNQKDKLLWDGIKQALERLIGEDSPEKENTNPVSPAQVDPLDGKWDEGALLQRLVDHARRQRWDLPNVIDFAAFSPATSTSHRQKSPAFPEWFRVGWLPPANEQWLERFDLLTRSKTTEAPTTADAIDAIKARQDSKAGRATDTTHRDS